MKRAWHEIGHPGVYAGGLIMPFNTVANFYWNKKWFVLYFVFLLASWPLAYCLRLARLGPRRPLGLLGCPDLIREAVHRCAVDHQQVEDLAAGELYELLV